MAMNLKANPALQEHLLKEQRLVAECSIVANATPANKQQAVDVPSVMILRTQGQTAAADAVESITWTAPVDNDGGDSVFGLLLDMSGNIADKVYKVTVTEKTSLAASISVSGPNGSASNLTADGNIAIEIAATGLNLASESPTFLVEVEYREAKP